MHQFNQIFYQGHFSRGRQRRRLVVQARCEDGGYLNLFRGGDLDGLDLRGGGSFDLLGRGGDGGFDVPGHGGDSGPDLLRCGRDGDLDLLGRQPGKD